MDASSRVLEMRIPQTAQVSLPRSLGKLGRLKTLKAASNRLRMIPAELATLRSSIQEVTFAGNEFSVADGVSQGA